MSNNEPDYTLTYWQGQQVCEVLQRYKGELLEQKRAIELYDTNPRGDGFQVRKDIMYVEELAALFGREPTFGDLLPDEDEDDELDVVLMNDQPPTCPKDGRRVDIIEGAETNKQIVKCPECGYTYRLEEDTDAEMD